MSGGRAIRLGVIGAGDVAVRDYLPEQGRLRPRAEIVAIASSDGARAADVAARFGIERSFAGYRSLIDDADVDAVVNLTPVRLHGDVNRAVVDAGLHLYSEKPFAASPHEGAEVARRARETGSILVCAPSVMVFPQVQRVARLLDDGAVGTVSTSVGQCLGGGPPWAGYESDPTPFFSPDVGPLVDVGVYPLHAVTGLLGPARRVSASSSRTKASFVQVDGSAAGRTIPVEVDDVWHLVVELASGSIASVRTDFAASGDSTVPDVELNGDRGALSVQLLDMTAPVRITRDGTTQLDEVPGGRPDGPDHLLGVEHLVDCIEGARPVLSVEHAVHVLEIIEAAGRSAQDGRVVELTTTFEPAGAPR